MFSKIIYYLLSYLILDQKKIILFFLIKFTAKTILFFEFSFIISRREHHTIVIRYGKIVWKEGPYC